MHHSHPRERMPLSIWGLAGFLIFTMSKSAAAHDCAYCPTRQRHDRTKKEHMHVGGRCQGGLSPGGRTRLTLADYRYRAAAFVE